MKKTGAFMLIMGLLMVGCETKTDCCVIVDTAVRVFYKTPSGNNLINSTPDFNASNIKIYYKNGASFDYIYRAHLDAPNMHRVDENESGQLLLTVYPSDYYENSDQSTTLIALNPQVVDTLVCHFELTNNQQICTHAWLNGQEMPQRFIEVEK